jgi:hypothetical protein
MALYEGKNSQVTQNSTENLILHKALRIKNISDVYIFNMWLCSSKIKYTGHGMGHERDACQIPVQHMVLGPMTLSFVLYKKVLGFINKNQESGQLGNWFVSIF